MPNFKEKLMSGVVVQCFSKEKPTSSRAVRGFPKEKPTPDTVVRGFSKEKLYKQLSYLKFHENKRDSGKARRCRYRR